MGSRFLLSRAAPSIYPLRPRLARVARRCRSILSVDFDAHILDHGIHEEAGAHLVDAVLSRLSIPPVQLELDDLPDANPPHLGKAQSAERPLNRDALHVENAWLEADEHA